MRISDWSSDVCSSDLGLPRGPAWSTPPVLRGVPLPRGHLAWPLPRSRPVPVLRVLRSGSRWHVLPDRRVGPRRLPAISTQVLHLHVGWFARHPPRHHRPPPAARPGYLPPARPDPPPHTR